MADNLFPRNTKQNLIEAIDDTPIVLIHGNHLSDNYLGRTGHRNCC
jgi:hypothetical protein